MAPRTANVCFTINNYTPAALAALRSLRGGEFLRRLQVTRETRVTYLAFQQETGETGTPHLQGYLQLERSITIDKVTDWLISIVGQGVHTEKTMGSSEQANDYVTKEDTRDEGTVPFIYGTIKPHAALRGQGARTTSRTLKRPLKKVCHLMILKLISSTNLPGMGRF